MGKFIKNTLHKDRSSLEHFGLCFVKARELSKTLGRIVKRGSESAHSQKIQVFFILLYENFEARVFCVRFFFYKNMCFLVFLFQNS